MQHLSNFPYFPLGNCGYGILHHHQYYKRSSINKHIRGFFSCHQNCFLVVATFKVKASCIFVLVQVLVLTQSNDDAHFESFTTTLKLQTTLFACVRERYKNRVSFMRLPWHKFVKCTIKFSQRRTRGF